MGASVVIGYYRSGKIAFLRTCIISTAVVSHDEAEVGMVVRGGKLVRNVEVLENHGRFRIKEGVRNQHHKARASRGELGKGSIALVRAIVLIGIEETIIFPFDILRMRAGITADLGT